MRRPVLAARRLALSCGGSSTNSLLLSVTLPRPDPDMPETKVVRLGRKDYLATLGAIGEFWPAPRGSSGAAHMGVWCYLSSRTSSASKRAADLQPVTDAELYPTK